jgi:hypothetical protein
LILFFPDTRGTFVKEQREDELLVIAGVDQAAQQYGSAPE